jgi:hypothetical protein
VDNVKPVGEVAGKKIDQALLGPAPTPAQRSA